MYTKRKFSILIVILNIVIVYSDQDPHPLILDLQSIQLQVGSRTRLHIRTNAYPWEPFKILWVVLEHWDPWVRIRKGFLRFLFFS